MLISSLQNPKIKALSKLANNHSRKSSGLFIVEGARELSLARASDFFVAELYICEEKISQAASRVLAEMPADTITYHIAPQVFAKLAYRDDSDGIIALCRQKQHLLQSLDLPANAFVLVLEAVEKPGNLGAILRTADATAANALILCDPRVDIYNPNVIRASVGCVFTVPIAVAPIQEAYSFLRQRGVHIAATYLHTNNNFFDIDYSQKPTAFVFGSEAEGISPFAAQNSDSLIKLPMLGKRDSLNVSVAAGVCAYELLRQRSYTHANR